MHRLALPILTAISLLAASAAAQSPGKKQFMAGVATSNITPWLGTNKVEIQASSKIRDALLEMFAELK